VGFNDHPPDPEEYLPFDSSSLTARQQEVFRPEAVSPRGHALPTGALAPVIGLEMQSGKQLLFGLWHSHSWLCAPINSPDVAQAVVPVPPKPPRKYKLSDYPIGARLDIKPLRQLD